MQEMHALAVDRRGELREGVEPRFPRPPVVVGAPILDKALDVARGHAVLPARRTLNMRRRRVGPDATVGRELVGEDRTGESGLQIIEVSLRDLDPERTDLI